MCFVFVLFSCIIAENCQGVGGFFEVKADQSRTCFMNEGSICSFRLLWLIFAYQCVSSNAKRCRQRAVDRTEVLLIAVVSFLEQVGDIVVDITPSTVDITVPVADPGGAAVQIMDCSSLPVQAEVRAGSRCFPGFKK